jgi:hypothetical protein
MLLNPGKSYTRDGATMTFPDVHMIYNAGNNFVHHQQNTNELIDAMAKKVHTERARRRIRHCCVSGSSWVRSIIFLRSAGPPW